MKKLATLMILAGIGLYGCNSGTSLPANQLQYGQLLSSTQFNFTNPAIQLPIALQEQFKTEGINQAFESSTSAGYESNLVNLSAVLKFNPNNVAANAAVRGVTSINAYSVTYNAPGVKPNSTPSDTNRTVSGLVLVPTLTAGKAPKGIVIYYHPTELSKNSVPSCLSSNLVSNSQSYCNFPNNPASSIGNNADGYYVGLAAVYAAAGYIVIAPDYVGMGIDYGTIHPYAAYPQVNALSGLYMLSATRQLLANLTTNPIPASQTLNLFLTGFSEGGPYALSASQLAQTSQANYLANNNIKLVGTAPAEGAYDLFNQMYFSFDNRKDGIFNGSFSQKNMMNATFTDTLPEVKAENKWKIINAGYSALSTPALVNYALVAAAYYSFNNNSLAYQQMMRGDYWSNITLMNSVGNAPSGQKVTLVQLFNNPNYTSRQMTSSIVANTLRMVNPNNGLRYDYPESVTVQPYLAGQSAINLGGGPVALQPITMPPVPYPLGKNNSIEAFVNRDVTELPQFKAIMNAANTYIWKTTSPINFIHLTYDSAVPVNNTDIAYEYMYNQAGSLVESTVIPNFQITNDLTQLSPVIATLFGVPLPLPISMFWTASLLPNLTILGSLNLAQITATPIDHGQAAPFMLIGALCAFEKQAAGAGANSNSCLQGN